MSYSACKRVRAPPASRKTGRPSRVPVPPVPSCSMAVFKTDDPENTWFGVFSVLRGRRATATRLCAYTHCAYRFVCRSRRFESVFYSTFFVLVKCSQRSLSKAISFVSENYVLTLYLNLQNVAILADIIRTKLANKI